MNPGWCSTVLRGSEAGSLNAILSKVRYGLKRNIQLVSFCMSTYPQTDANGEEGSIYVHGEQGGSYSLDLMLLKGMRPYTTSVSLSKKIRVAHELEIYVGQSTTCFADAWPEGEQAPFNKTASLNPCIIFKRILLLTAVFRTLIQHVLVDAFEQCSYFVGVLFLQCEP